MKNSRARNQSKGTNNVRGGCVNKKVALHSEKMSIFTDQRERYVGCHQTVRSKEEEEEEEERKRGGRTNLMKEVLEGPKVM